MKRSTLRPFRMLLALVLLAGLAGTSAALADQAAYDRCVKSTVYIESDAGAGSGSLIDLERKLVLTNQHVVEDDKSVEVVFAQMAGDRVEQEASFYRERFDELYVNGRVVWTDATRDLALIQLETLPEDAVAIPLASESARPGQPLFAIGNSSTQYGGYFTYVNGAARGVFSSHLMIGVRIVDANIPVNRGDSGGPVLNHEGELVAVTCHGVPNRVIGDKVTVRNGHLDLEEAVAIENSRNHFIDISEVRGMLLDASLGGAFNAP